MDEYIEREALLAAYDAAHEGEPGRARKLIEDAPAADVAPVVHGRWIPCDNGGHYCSNCDRRIAFRVGHYYCHHCGARMDGE